MRTVRLALLGLSICLLSACEVSDATGPDAGNCGYLGSSGCHATPIGG